MDDITGVQEGHVIKHDSVIGQLKDLFHAFQQEWSVRWDRHRDVDNSMWDPFDCLFPKLPFPNHRQWSTNQSHPTSGLLVSRPRTRDLLLERMGSQGFDRMLVEDSESFV